MTDVPRHNIFVKVGLVRIFQMVFMFARHYICVSLLGLIISDICVDVHLVSGVLFGDRDHSSWVASHVPYTNVASPYQ